MNHAHQISASLDASRPSRTVRWLDGLLGLSAAALAALAIVQVAATSAIQPVAKAGGETRAGMLAAVGDYTLMSVDIGNDDALLLLDSRAEEVVVYRADNQAVMQVAQRMNLPRTFAEARTRSGVKSTPAPDSRETAKEGPRENKSNPPR